MLPTRVQLLLFLSASYAGYFQMLNKNKQSPRVVDCADDESHAGTKLGGLQIRFCATASLADRALTDCVVITMSSDGKLSPAAASLDRELDGILVRLIERGSATGKLGSALSVPLVDEPTAKAALLMGSGEPGHLTPDRFKQLVTATYDELVALGARDAVLHLSQVVVTDRNEYWKIRQQVIIMEEAAYCYHGGMAHKSPHLLSHITLAGSGNNSLALEDGLAFATAITTARTLADTPPNICTPTFLADYAVTLADQFPSMTAEILNEKNMSELGMNAMLSVGMGSAQPSRLVILNYRGIDTTVPPIVIIGKGVTFDTGGTSLKSGQAMRLMKYDMCGAAAVVGAMQAIAILGLPINVICICACAENMPGGRATRPSDTVMSMSGKSIEVLNPDAEGRLLLCDALSYAERFDPQLVIDVATLTGASLVALGRHHSALFTPDDELSLNFSDAGEIAMDKVWRLPLSEEDQEQLDSQFADLANIGDGTAGCVVAALFLSRFAKAYPWVHLDVSGTAKKHGDTVGATGRPVALLLQFLLNRTRQGAIQISCD